MKTPKPLPPLDYLHACFRLCVDSPSGLFWRHRPADHFTSDRIEKSSNTQFAGKIAGYIRIINPKADNPHRLWMVGIDGQHFHAHRVVWAMCHGCDPGTMEIDHIDRNALNNAIDNLRVATRSDNCTNRRIFSNNTSGIKGVFWHKQSRRWEASIGLNGKSISLGRFDDIEDARKAREEASIRLHAGYSLK